MGFTTPAFIRKNTPELRKKLEVLGYLFIPNGWNEWSIPIENCEYLLCDTDTYQGNPISYYTGKVCKPNLGIDCGTNEVLFIALAALRDDTDKFQWFTDSKKWFQCQYLKVGMHYHDKPEILFEKWHKATVNELVEHFKEGEE